MSNHGYNFFGRPNNRGPNRIERNGYVSITRAKRPHSYGSIPWILSSVIAIIAIAFAWSNANAQTVGVDSYKIVAFGDSLSAGYQLPTGSGFTDQLQVLLQKSDPKISVTNAAVSGDTTSSGRARLDWSVPDDTDLVILELGANDALQGLPVEQAKANLDWMIQRLKDRNIKILLAGMRAPPNMGAEYGKAFDAIYPELAKKHAIPFYPFFLDGVAAQPDLNLADGIHPNKQGIAIITDKIAPLVLDVVNNNLS